MTDVVVVEAQKKTWCSFTCEFKVTIVEWYYNNNKNILQTANQHVLPLLRDGGILILKALIIGGRVFLIIWRGGESNLGWGGGVDSDNGNQRWVVYVT